MRKAKYVILITYCVGLLSFLIFNFTRSGRVEAQTVEQPTVEQTRKNIQLLKGLPDSQLMITMNFMRASLGVSCAYCHVVTADGKWEFEKDDIPAKMIARKHIQITFGLNKTHFGGQLVITCNTCHQGQIKPATLPVLPQTPPEGGAAGMKPAVILPAVDRILDKYIQALGGRAAIEKVQTRVMKGSQITWDGTALPLEIYQAAPNKFRLSVTLSNAVGVVSQGFNGTIGWIKNPRGLRELRGRDLTAIQRSAEIYSSLKFMEIFPNLKVTVREKINDRDVFVAESITNSDETVRLFFDAENGLLLRRQIIAGNVLAPIPEQLDFDDYRDVDGVKLPFIIRQSYVDPWIGWTRKFTEIKQNIPVEDAKFDMLK